MSQEERYREAKELQEKGQFLDESEKLGGLGSDKPTEYAKSAKMVVDKMFNPQTREDMQLLTRIPEKLIINTIMLESVEKSIEELYKGDLELWDNKKKTVTLYLNADNQQTPDSDVKNNLIKYRTVSQKGYAEAHFFKKFWHGINGSLLTLMPAREGEDNRANQGVKVIGSIVTSDRELIEAQNNAQVGWFRRQYHKVFK